MITAQGRTAVPLAVGCFGLNLRYLAGATAGTGLPPARTSDAGDLKQLTSGFVFIVFSRYRIFALAFTIFNFPFFAINCTSHHTLNMLVRICKRPGGRLPA